MEDDMNEWFPMILAILLVLTMIKMFLASKDHHFAAKMKHLMIPVILLFAGTTLYMIFFFSATLQNITTSTSGFMYFLYYLACGLMLNGFLMLAYKMITLPNHGNQAAGMVHMYIQYLKSRA